MHSGFDFIDESPVRRRHQSQSQDPFDDPRRTEYGETWYQDPHDDNFTEYLDDERTSQYLNDRHRLTDFSAIDGPTERFSRLDDGMTTAFGDNLKTGASGLTANIRNSGGSANTFAPPVPPSRGTPFSVYEDGMTATSSDHSRQPILAGCLAPIRTLHPSHQSRPSLPGMPTRQAQHRGPDRRQASLKLNHSTTLEFTEATTRLLALVRSTLPQQPHLQAAQRHRRQATYFPG